MILNSKSRNIIQVGTRLKDSGHVYTIILKDTQGNGRHIYITTKTEDGQTLYYMPLSFYYGTTILEK